MDIIEQLNIKTYSSVNGVDVDKLHVAVLAELAVLRAQLEDFKASQQYRYIGKDGKPVLARALEDERDLLREDNERLRVALEPFAKAHDGRRRADILGGACFKQEVLKAAKEALK